MVIRMSRGGPPRGRPEGRRLRRSVPPGSAPTTRTTSYVPVVGTPIRPWGGGTPSAVKPRARSWPLPTCERNHSFSVEAGAPRLLMSFPTARSRPRSGTPLCWLQPRCASAGSFLSSDLCSFPSVLTAVTHGCGSKSRAKQASTAHAHPLTRRIRSAIASGRLPPEAVPLTCGHVPEVLARTPMPIAPTYSFRETT